MLLRVNNISKVSVFPSFHIPNDRETAHSTSPFPLQSKIGKEYPKTQYKIEDKNDKATSASTVS